MGEKVDSEELKSKICGWGWCVEDEVGVNRRRRGWLRRMKWG